MARPDSIAMSTSSSRTKGTITAMMLKLGLGQLDMTTPGVEAPPEAWQTTGILSSARFRRRRPARLPALALATLAATTLIPAAMATTAADPAAAPANRPASVRNSLGMELVWIAPGSYERGSPATETGHRANETLHRVTLTRGFWLGATAVTQAQFETVMQDNPTAFADPRRPADNVPWFDWVRFCNLLSEREGLQPAYRIDGVDVVWDRAADGYRLPTEAEWEYACRAGTTTRFWAGNRTSELVEVAWFRANSDWQTQPVGGKAPNPWGLYDMHGNVFEWCWDWYAPYTGDDLVDPLGAVASGRRVLRGGGWGSYSRGCRSAYRLASEPSARRAWYGARLARGAVAPVAPVAP